jgi:nitroreductase
MEFQDVVRKRRMVRSFEDRPLPVDVVQRILTNAQPAPDAAQAAAYATRTGPVG